MCHPSRVNVAWGLCNSCYHTKRYKHVGRTHIRRDSPDCPPNRPPVPEPTESPSIMDIAWAAGVFEGEGSLAVTQKYGTHASISQKDKWLIERFQALFGGSLYLINHLTTKGEPTHFWLWTAYGPRGRGFLFTVYRFLSPRRRRQIDFIIARWRGKDRSSPIQQEVRQ